MDESALDSLTLLDSRLRRLETVVKGTTTNDEARSNEDGTASQRLEQMQSRLDALSRKNASIAALMKLCTEDVFATAQS